MFRDLLVIKKPLFTLIREFIYVVHRILPLDFTLVSSLRIYKSTVRKLGKIPYNENKAENRELIACYFDKKTRGEKDFADSDR